MKYHAMYAFFLTFLIFTAELGACTGIKLTARDGSMVSGRTVEFGVPLNASSAVVPKGYAFVGTTPNGKGLPYTSKYGVVGIICYDEPAILDGINERGLCVCSFYFPEYAQYATISSANQSKALSPTEFPNWILTQFATIEEVKAALSSVVIAPTVMKDWGPAPPPFHYIVYAQNGDGLVIEPRGGQLVTSDNPIGTLTNSPTFDWHMTHLRSYINLSVENPAPLTIDGMTLSPFGYGAGLVGLPGDFSPPSRFVQAALFSAFSIPSSNAQEAVWDAFHVLNQFDIPKGVSQAKEDGVTHVDYTMLTTVKDPQSLQYYFKTYDDQTIQVIDLNKFDLSSKTIKTAPLDSQERAVDFSSKLK